MKQRIFTENAPVPGKVLSQAYVLANMVFCSGQTGVNPDTKMIPEDFEAQAGQCCENIKAVLKAAGAELEDTVKTTCFLTDPANTAKFNAVYEKYFIGKPARSCVIVKGLPNEKALCEIEAIAELKEE